MTIKRTMTLAAVGALGAVIAMGAWQQASAQGQVFAYPKGKQSAQQQQKDHGECNRWAINQANFDPSRQQVYVQQGSSSPPPRSSGLFGRGEYGQGGGVADAGKGAAGGALIGAIAGNAGAGAAIGALSGLFIGGVKRSNQAEERRQWEQQQQSQRRQQEQQISQQRAQGMHAYNRAFSLCMEARNYSVQ
jgi:hypothetical protein